MRPSLAGLRGCATGSSPSSPNPKNRAGGGAIRARQAGGAPCARSRTRRQVLERRHTEARESADTAPALREEPNMTDDNDRDDRTGDAEPDTTGGVSPHHDAGHEEHTEPAS